MRKLVPIILLFFAQYAIAQLTIKPIVKTENQIRGRQAATKSVSPATLPFWDDFSITTDSPDGIRIWGRDTTSQWNAELSENVYVNATLAINPPTYMVATFDGLDANGSFYADEKGLADQLVSDTINLQGKANVVLSFYWQAGGNVEIPEKGDSLTLQFHREINGISTWETVWAKDGEDLESDQNSVFTQVGIVLDSKFLTQKFLFRFQSYGARNGPFDAWHVDWIYLNENRGTEDYYYQDRGLTGQLTSPFSPYKSLPPHQFKANMAAVSSNQTVQAYNLDSQIQATEYILVIRNQNNNTVVDFVEYGMENPLLSNPDPSRILSERIIELDGIDLSPIPNQDSINLLSEVYLENSDDDFLDGTSINLKINDTIRTPYLLHNYYAYDDGTAEYAVGTNTAGGQVAIKFWLEESDTLTHIDIHFPNINPSSSGRSLTLKILKRLDDDYPLRSQPISIITGSAINEFTRYQLTRPIVLTDTFFVAYEQGANEYIGIGFDRSNPEALKYIYENKTGLWEKYTKHSGALMIRPVFDKPGSLIAGLIKKEKLIVYPNPTKNSIRIDRKYEAITVMDFSGKILMQEKVNQFHDFSSLNTGVYLLTIHRKEGDQTIKIIKE